MVSLSGALQIHLWILAGELVNLSVFGMEATAVSTLTLDLLPVFQVSNLIQSSIREVLSGTSFFIIATVRIIAYICRINTTNDQVYAII